MKLLLIVSLLCINSLSAPPDTSKRKAEPKPKPAAVKPSAKPKASAPLLPSVLIVDLF